MFEWLIGLLATVAVYFLLEAILLYIGDLIIRLFLGWMSWSGARAFNGRPVEEREAALVELRSYAKDRWRDERDLRCSLVFAFVWFILSNGHLLWPPFLKKFAGLLVDCPEAVEEPATQPAELAAEPDGEQAVGVSLYKAPEPSEPVQWNGSGGPDPHSFVLAHVAKLRGGNRWRGMPRSKVRGLPGDAIRRVRRSSAPPEAARFGFAPSKGSADAVYTHLKGQAQTGTEPRKQPSQREETTLGMVCKNATLDAKRRNC